MKRSRAYILTEIMMSMLLQSMFVVILASAFYMMLTFYTRTQQLQTARDRGHRVISYVDQRIRHAGLGLWACDNSKMIADFFKNGGPMKSYGMNLPVSVMSKEIVLGAYFDTKDFNSNPKQHFYRKDGAIFKGNVATIIYTYGDFDDSRKFILKKNSKVTKATSQGSVSLVDSKGINGAGFNSGADTSNNYSVTESLGLPLGILGNVCLNLDIASSLSRTIYAGSELLHVGCTRLFVTYNAIPEERSFAFELPQGDKWSQAYHHVAGILEIYMELHAPKNDTKTFDLYVLSTGGRDGSRTRKSRPVTWPKDAHWEDRYGEQVLYVSRASWKLDNIPPNFVFSYPES